MKLVLLSLLALSSLPAFAQLDHGREVKLDAQSFACQGKSGTMTFVWNHSTGTIQFSDIAAFGTAQMLKNAAFGVNLDVPKTISFKYNWYYTANYSLEFLANPLTYQAGDKILVHFNGDDDDGFTIDDTLTCAVQ